MSTESLPLAEPRAAPAPRPVGFLRRAADGCAFLLALPLLAWYSLESLLLGKDRAFESTVQAVSLLPGTLGVVIRRAFLRATLARCSRSCNLSFGTLWSDRRAVIGEWVYVGPHCDLGWVTIEDDVLLGSGVHVLSGKGQHGIADPELPIRLQEGKFAEVRIGAGSWIGNGAIVMANVGRGCVVAAGAVVVHDVEDFSIVGGNPAKLIRKRNA
jgi:acetyltransferase-like isoleucine patch superfamily enzyme